MSSSRDEDRQQALSHHPPQDLVPPASRLSPPGDADAEDNVGSSHGDHSSPPSPPQRREEGSRAAGIYSGDLLQHGQQVQALPTPGRILRDASQVTQLSADSNLTRSTSSDALRSSNIDAMDLKEAQEQLTASLLEHADGQLADSSVTTEAQSFTGAPDEDSVSIDLNDEDQQGGYGAGRHQRGGQRRI